jgi:hypothetical protein
MQTIKGRQEMKKTSYIIMLCLAVLAGGYYLFNRYEDRKWLATTDAGMYKPYVLGTNIGFKTGGNSTDFVRVEDGWGAPGKDFTFTIGKDTIMKLFIKDGANENLRVDMIGFGLHPDDEEYQEMEVYANGTKVRTMRLFDKQEYFVRIPAKVMQTEELTIKFHFNKPYKPKDSKVSFGMSVEKMSVHKDYLIETKRAIYNWLIKVL